MDKFKKFFIFFFCLCIAFFPLVNTLTVHADGGYTYDFITTYGLPSDPVYFNVNDYNSSSIYINGYVPFFGTLSNYNTFYSSLSNINVSSAIPNFGTYKNFLIYRTNSYYYIIFLPEDSVIISNQKCLGCLIPNGSDLTYLYYNNSNHTYGVSSLSLALYDNYRVFITTSSESAGLTLSNMPVLSDNSTVTGKNLYNNYAANSSNFNNINYLNYNSWGKEVESSSNNLYMDNAKWSFDIPYYSLDQSGATYGTGTATFSGSLNEFQISNTSDFTLEFLFTSFLTGYRYSWAQDSEREDFGYKYIYSTEISLSDFYSNGQVASFNISDIFDNSISVNPTHLGQSITEDCQVISNSQAVNLSNWYTTFTVALKSNDEYSGKCSSMFSYLLRKSKNTDNSMQTNNNPYTGEEGSNSVPDSDIFNGESSGASAGNSNSTSNIGDYSVVNNNNPHITINNNNDNGFTNAIENGDSDGLLSKLLLLLANNQSTTCTGISEIADTDGYVQVMGSVFTAVPAAWWTTLTVAFVACIGILVVSFVIKIILKFVL